RRAPLSAPSRSSPRHRLLRARGRAGDLLDVGNLRFTGDALAPLHHIDEDHVALARMMLAWFGQWWRLYGLVYWPIAVLGVITPVFGALALWGSFRALRRREPGWDLAALAWLPALYLTFRTAVLADFRPMARFALVAATLSLLFIEWGHEGAAAPRPSCPRHSRTWRGLAVVVLVATPLFLFA